MIDSVLSNLLTGASHPYSCTCRMCAAYWKSIGPDPDSGLFGPFGSVLPDGTTAASFGNRAELDAAIAESESDQTLGPDPDESGEDDGDGVEEDFDDAETDPDRLSFTRTLRVARRTTASHPGFSPSGP